MIENMSFVRNANKLDTHASLNIKLNLNNLNKLERAGKLKEDNQKIYNRETMIP